MGFCVFCNAAAAAQHALDRGAQRVAILDWDVHHGNGIQDCVATGELREGVRFVSIHQGDAYPDVEAQRRSNLNTVNVPLKRGTGGKAFLEALATQGLPFLEEFDPDLLIVAAGYDALAIDSVAQLSLFPEDFAAASQLVKLKFGRKVVFGLEGGYQLDQLPQAVTNTLRPFVGAQAKPEQRQTDEEQGKAGAGFEVALLA